MDLVLLHTLMLITMASMNQHPTNEPVGNSVHWMGWDFSSSSWMCVAFVDLFGADLVFGCFFSPNFEITCPVTYYLPTENQLPPPSHLPTYQIHTPFSHLNLSNRSYPPTLPPTYLPNTYIMSMATNENNSNVGIAFSSLTIK